MCITFKTRRIKHVSSKEGNGGLNPAGGHISFNMISRVRRAIDVKQFKLKIGRRFQKLVSTKKITFKIINKSRNK